MMNKSALVGLLFFTALSVVGYFTIITEGGPFKKGGGAMKVYFPSADGLKIGNKITVQGIPYGYVSSVKLVMVDENDNLVEDQGMATKVELSLVLKGPVTLYPNYDITIKNESILSGRIVAIDPGHSDPENPEPPIIMGDKNLKPVSSTFKGKITEDPLVILSELIAENRADVRTTISNLANITEKINQGEGTVGKLINSDEIHSNVNTVLTDAQIVLREVREGLEDTREQAPVTSFIRAALSAF